MLLPHAQPAAECEAALSAQTSTCFVHFPLLAPDTSDGNGVDSFDDARLSINVAIAKLMVRCSCRCRFHVPRTATVAPLVDVAQTLIDDLGSDAQRLQLFDVFAAAGGTDQARLLRRVVGRLDAQHVAA